VGAAMVEGGIHAVNWGGIESGKPVGVFGTLIALAISPVLGGLVAFLVIRSLRRLGRRLTRAWDGSVIAGQWAMSSALAFSHGANDAQKAVGVVAALLLGAGKADTLSAPTWATFACAGALTLGTAFGGWRIIRTVGRRIYRLQSIEGLASQTSSAGVILGASLLGAPTSTSQVVASSVVGIGGGRRRLRHVNWSLVRQIGLAWLITMPVTGLLAAGTFEAWRWLT
jgi:inorganic phosphate transporter, PiT family